jgi:hypothetical protein
MLERGVAGLDGLRQEGERVVAFGAVQAGQVMERIAAAQQFPGVRQLVAALGMLGCEPEAGQVAQQAGDGVRGAACLLATSAASAPLPARASGMPSSAAAWMARAAQCPVSMVSSLRGPSAAASVPLPDVMIRGSFRQRQQRLPASGGQLCQSTVGPRTGMIIILTGM